ncbi:MAG: hypothetical protein V4724_28220 [Pseudomonadota bacterium]
MKPTLSWVVLLPCLWLSACSGGSDDPTSNVTLASQPQAGKTSAFLVSGDPAGSFGEAYLDAEGKGLIVVGANDGKPAQALYRLDGRTVQRSPGALSGTVTIDQDSTAAIRSTALTRAQLAGSYTMQVDGASFDFQIGADGKIAPSGSGCQLSGNVTDDAGASGALPVALTLSGCAVAGSFNGYLLKPADNLPNAVRLVADDGKRVLDAFAIGTRSQ